MDYPDRRRGGGARARERPYRAVQEAVEWFGGQTDGLGLLLIGYCYGTRVIIRRAQYWNGVVAAALIKPHLQRAARRTLPTRVARRAVLPLQASIARVRHDRRRRRQRAKGRRRLDPGMTDLLLVAARRFPVWILVGRRGAASQDFRAAMTNVEAHGVRVDVEVLPGIGISSELRPESLDEFLERVSGWARRCVGNQIADVEAR
jgi:dienelactone hydrolase